MNTILGHVLIDKLVEMSKRDFRDLPPKTIRAIACLPAIDPHATYTWELAGDLVRELEEDMIQRRLKDICE